MSQPGEEGEGGQAMWRASQAKRTGRMKPGGRILGAFEELPVMLEDGEPVAMGAWRPERETALPLRCCRATSGALTQRI